MNSSKPSTNPPEDWDGHPIRHIVAQLLEDGGPGEEAAVLSRQALSNIKSEMDMYLGTAELVDVVETLLLVAKYLETEHEAIHCALSLANLCERDVVINALKDLNRAKDGARAEVVAKTANRFTDFTGTESARKAPERNAPVPKGALKAGSLDFPKKL